MSYVNKGKTLIQNRRISCKFRDSNLLKVFEITIDILKELHSKLGSSDGDTEILRAALHHSLSLAHK